MYRLAYCQATYTFAHVLLRVLLTNIFGPNGARSCVTKTLFSDTPIAFDDNDRQSFIRMSLRIGSRPYLVPSECHYSMYYIWNTIQATPCSSLVYSSLYGNVSNSASKPMWLVQGHDSPNVGFKAPYGLAERRYGSARASWVVINCLNLRDKTTRSKVVSSSRF